ncbi:FAD-dependent monooxygenase [Paraburkholderia aspalathi]|uniref:FAD-dependent monooxygenase n=1 Tax=Paraburkholderia aspalathi TaxID=1324617 RepID=UPI0038B8746A
MPSNTHDMHIAIVGAGITGLSLAAALGRCGIDFEIFEQAPGFDEIGAGLQLAPNAVRLLNRLGLAERLSDVAVRSTALEMRRWDRGDVAARMPLGVECEALFGAPYYLLTRPDLHTLLLGLVPQEKVRVGMTCTALQETPDGVELHFADGTVTTADAVVGADGIHSSVRRQWIRDEPKFSGQTVYRGLVPAERLSFLFDEPKSIIWAGPGKHIICYPVAAGRLVNFVATVPAREWHAESWSEPAKVEDVVDAFAGWDPTIEVLLESADKVTRWALHLRDTAPRWSSRHVTLAGDAAHPMMPFMAQGANQGIEDAMALAAALRQSSLDGIPAALHRYETARRPRTIEVQQRSAAMATTFHSADGDQQKRRDGEMNGSRALHAMEWIFGHDADPAWQIQ